MDYVGRKRYVITHLPYSYINHSCNPNTFVKFITIAKSRFVASRDIKKGEELTCDYGVTAMDHIEDTKFVLECRCGTKNYREKIPVNFFRQPISIQKRYWRNLPPSIKRKYRHRFRKL